MSLKSGEVLSDQFYYLKNIKILVSSGFLLYVFRENPGNIQRKFIGIFPIKGEGDEKEAEKPHPLHHVGLLHPVAGAPH